MVKKFERASLPGKDEIFFGKESQQTHGIQSISQKSRKGEKENTSTGERPKSSVRPRVNSSMEENPNGRIKRKAGFHLYLDLLVKIKEFKTHLLKQGISTSESDIVQKFCEAHLQDFDNSISLFRHDGKPISSSKR